MNLDKYESNLKIYEKLLDYAKNILKECGWDENASNSYTYNKRKPSIDEFLFFSHQAKSIVEDTLGKDSNFYEYIIDNSKDPVIPIIFGFIYKKNLIPAYELYKKMYSFKVEENKDIKYLKKIRPINEFKNLKWEAITIKFIDGVNVLIYSGDIKNKANYKDMGFEDSRTFKPNMQWTFLKYLAQNNNEINWKDKEASPKVKKYKQLLSMNLNAFFQIAESPFYIYKKEKAYRIRLNLIPE